jgi:hypothetical protein
LFCRPIRDEFSTKTKQDYSFVSVLSTVRNGLTARKNARKTNFMYFLRKKRPYSHKKSSQKGVLFL